MSERSLSVPAHWRNLLRDPSLPRTAKTVGWCLSTYMDASGFAFPSLLTLAIDCGLGRGCTAVKDAITTLEAEGLLQVDRNRGRRGWTFQALIPRGAVGFSGGEILRPAVGLNGSDGSKIPRGADAKSHGTAAEIPRPAVGESAESAESISTRRSGAGGKGSRTKGALYTPEELAALEYLDG